MVDSELCEVYHWTWQELQNTPAYFRTYCWQVQQMKRQAQADANRREQGMVPHA